jgi:hypothetical protein
MKSRRVLGEDFLNRSKTMKMPLKIRLYLGKRLGMIMKSRRIGFYRMIKISV